MYLLHSQGVHPVLSRKAAGGDGTEQAPPCFVLSDQNFPPLVPAEGEGDCLKIFQIENCSLSDLTGAFLDAVKGYAMPVGTVVIISSVSHLSAVGTQSYTEDVVRAFRTLKKAYRSGITVMHGFPLLLSGLSNTNTIKELLEICNWHNSVISNGAKDISRTRKLFMDSLLTSSSHCNITGSDTSSNSRTDYSTANNSSRPLMLPSSLTEYEKKRFETKGFGSQVSLCLPITEKDEIRLMTSHS